jgi:hypothetical protein
MRAPDLIRGLLLAGLATAQLSAAPCVALAAAPGPDLMSDGIAPSLPSNQTIPGIEPGWLGLSGKLRAIFVLPPEGYDQSGAVAAEPALPEVSHRVYVVTPLAATQDSLCAIPLIPFAAKQGTVLQGYRIGVWPQERRRVRSSYVSPEGFIEVTPENQLTRVSENFRLIDFLTHDQDNVWPKYLVLRPQLVDKLELISNELARRGKPSTIKILSGFRSPQYNAQGVGRKGGRARDSRHMYGDAADVYVDGNGDDRMDDLNDDGRVNYRDSAYLLAIAEYVQDQYPEVIGGGASYRATGMHGPFVHVDVRGYKARW